MAADDEQVRWHMSLEPYFTLLSAFVDRRLSGVEFEAIFFPLYRGDDTHWSPQLFRILEGLFFQVDEFYEDPEHRPECDGVSEEDLRASVRQTLTALLSYRR